MAQDIRLNSVWNANAQAMLNGSPASFVNPPTWSCSNENVCDILGVTGNGTVCQIHGVAMGSADLTVTADGVSSTIQINVLPPFDSISVSFAQIS